MLTALTTRISIALLVIATILPLLPVGAWTVRLFDFPRLQFVALLLVPVGGLICWNRLSGWSIEQSGIAILCGAVLVWQLSHVAKYTPLWKHELPTCSPNDSHLMTVTVVNLDYENTQKTAVLDQLAKHDSDLLLLIEVDEAWSDALKVLEKSYPHRDGIVRGAGLGIMLWSKIPFVDSEVRHLVSEKRASVFASIQPEDGPRINVVGLHPTPPGLPDADGVGRHNSRIRDAELMILAKIISNRSNEKWIVTGDFNDVAWSHTSRIFKRISGLKDPRVGRGLYNTYHAEHFLIRFPIDQVFLSPGAFIADLERFRPNGSDHFAISATFSIKQLEPTDSKPERDDLQDTREMIQEGKEEALERGDAAMSSDNPSL